jgi:tetratricopeptide (TPR) repeat protein
MTMGQGGGEAAPPAGGEPAAAAVIVATTILLFLFFLYQVFFSRPRNKGGFTGHARNLLVNAVPIAARRGALVSRCASRAWLGLEMVHCCANCGEDGGISLKACKSCMLVKYCNADCQRKHWPKHKKECKQRAAELRDEALFEDELPAKEECPICLVPMPHQLIACVSLPPATISSVPVNDFGCANEELAGKATEIYYSCCGKSICRGCLHSFEKSGNIGTCAFCKTERLSKTDEEIVEELMKRVSANDAGAICALASSYVHGQLGLPQDRARAMELYARAAELKFSKAHYFLGAIYKDGGNLKKAKFHYETAAMAGHEVARYFLGYLEYKLGNKERAVKHWKIAASSGDYSAMYTLRSVFEQGAVSRNAIDSILTAYNNSCTEMRSEARDAYIRMFIDEQ